MRNIGGSYRYEINKMASCVRLIFIASYIYIADSSKCIRERENIDSTVKAGNMDHNISPGPDRLLQGQKDEEAPSQLAEAVRRKM